MGGRTWAALGGAAPWIARASPGGSWVPADQFSRADIALVPHLNTCGFIGLSPGDDTPHLATWLARMNERESVKRVTQEAISSLDRKDDAPFFDNDRLHWRSDRIEQMLRIGMGPWLLEELAADRAFLPPLP